ncbi:phage holin family protein [Actinoplanes rectilineatus]|uniref:phage holin family protein n=1 Tax=Actinoplanes rectilineatus TaxID=113571 RepID=UPI0005F2B559|nr:phage holin family protein [Actinoplanes rectilineatus]
MRHTDAEADHAQSENARTAQLIGQLSDQVTTLVRDELAAARLELAEKGRRAGKGAGLISASGVMAVYGLGTLFLTAGAALALVMPAWTAAIVVALLLLAIAAFLALGGKHEVQQAIPPTPETALASGRRDVATFVAAARHGRNS